MQYLLIIATIGGLLFGYGTGVISGAMLFINESFHLHTMATEITVASVVLGAVIGALVNGKICELYGRRYALFFAGTCFTIGSICCAIAPNITILIIARIIVGFAVGISSFSGPLYISELAHAKHRGALVTVNTMTITGGIVLAYVVNYLLAYAHNWRLMFGLGAIPGAILAIGMLFLPQSPRWLVTKGFTDKAFRVLQKLRTNYSLAAINNELEQIKAMATMQLTKHRLFDPALKPVLIAGFGLAAIQQLGGANMVLYYAPIVFQKAGLGSTFAQLVATIGIGTINFLMTVLAIWLVDKLGRRQLLLGGLIAMAITLGTLGFALLYTAQIIAIISLFTYISAFAVSTGCLFWLIIAEIFPLNVRGKAMSLAAAINWFTNLLLSATFLTLVKFIHITGAFWLFATFNLLSFIFCYFLIPETKGVSLEQIEENLRAGKPARKLGL